MKDLPPRPDPDMLPIMERMRARPMPEGPPDPAALRAAPPDLFAYLNRNPPALARVEDLSIPGPFGATRVRLYDGRQGRDAPAPVLVWFHGGGWVGGSVDLEDRAVRELALLSGVAILSVDYVLAPEHPFPEPLEDCASALRFVALHGGDLGLDRSRIAVGGASAGANLALAAAMQLRDASEAFLRFILLHYGVFARRTDSPSHRQFGGGDWFLTTAAMEAFWDCYLGPGGDSRDRRVSLLDADPAGLPPVYLTAAGLDPLRDDSIDLAARLAGAGGEVTLRLFPGVVHGFHLMVNDLEAARVTARETAVALSRALG
ncbi:alpha/beta hydrolase [Thermaurantiacus sp.]